MLWASLMTWLQLKLIGVHRLRALIPLVFLCFEWLLFYTQGSPNSTHHMDWLPCSWFFSILLTSHSQQLCLMPTLLTPCSNLQSSCEVAQKTNMAIPQVIFQALQSHRYFPEWWHKLFANPRGKSLSSKISLVAALNYATLKQLSSYA